MDYQELVRKRDAYQEGKHLIPELTIASYERAFEIEYTHHSTAIEGNTLTLMETKLVLEDRISGAVRLRQIPAEDRVANTTFQENICYVRRTQSGESWQLYTQIKAAAETKDCFVLLTDRRNGQVYPKRDFTMGTPEQFRTLIEKKTGLKIQKFC